MNSLDRKLLRDLTRMKGQVIAVSLVMACGLAMMIMTRSLIVTLETERNDYYRNYRMADAFVSVKRAPMSMADRIAKIPGVRTVEPRVVLDVTLDLPEVLEPATGHIVSLPENREARLNQLFLRRGRMPATDERRHVVVGEAFAVANQLELNDEIYALINGRREKLIVCGIGLSPEFVFEARAGETLPDNRRFGVIWMNYEAVAVAYNMDGAFNDLCMELDPGVTPETVLRQVDQWLLRYGTTGAYTRKDQASATRLEDEIRVLGALSLVYPVVFLSVAAFMVNAVLARLIRLQREQIAQMKAQGYSGLQVGLHYLKFALVLVVIGSLLGGGGGWWMGANLVNMYQDIFRFPELRFRLDWSALNMAIWISLIASMMGVIGVVWQAVRLPPAEAMRPEAPPNFKASIVERMGFKKFLSPTMSMAFRNIERRPFQSIFTAAGIALATGLMVLPGAMSNSIDYLLTFQWNLAQRQDVIAFFTEPNSPKSPYALGNLPGVHVVESIRSVSSKLRFGHRERKVPITGLPPQAELIRLLDEDSKVIDLPEEGMFISAKLAEILEVKLGDSVQVEVLEGRRPKRDVMIRGLITDYAGVNAYMHIDAVRKLMSEGETINGAYLSVDHSKWEAFMQEVKETPKIAMMLVKKDQLESFRSTIGKSIGILRRMYFILAVIVAFGVVYNSARIALSERSRELATLRVVGFTQGEVAKVLVGELSMLVLMALPVGLIFGKYLTVYLMSTFSTETVRMPLSILPSTYAMAVTVVAGAALLSFVTVTRLLNQLDMVSVLKARD